MPARTERSTPAYGEGRDALLRAAIKVTAERGLRGLTYRAVAEEAGVAHGLVRFHFGSRDALIVAATQYSLPESIKFGELSTGNINISEFGTAVPNMILSDGDLLAFQYEVIMESRRRPELRAVVDELYSELRRATIEDLKGRGIDTNRGLGLLVFAALDGLVLQGVALDDHTEIKEALVALRTVLEYAKSHPEAFRS